MAEKTGGLWEFIKRLFGFGKTEASRSSFPLVSDEVVDQEMIESYAYDEEKAHREAREMIAKSLEDEKTNPDDPDVFYQRATGYSILGDDAQALKILDAILSADPDYIDAYRLKASIYDGTENFEEVVSNLDRAISLHSAGEQTGADGILPDIDELLSKYDRQAKAEDYENRASAHLNLENYEAAIDDFTKALEAEPDNDYLYSSRGQAYLGAGNLGKALEDLNKAIEIDGNHYNYSRRAAIYKALGYTDAALADASKAIALNEADQSEFAQYFDGYFERAEIYMEKGDYNAAVRDLSVQIERDPDYIEPYEKRAAAYRHLGMDALAEADERKAAELADEVD